MKQFKKGDKVKRVAGYHEGMQVGDTAVVRQQASFDRLCLEGYESPHDPENFELVQDNKESIKQFLKENKWFIRTGSPEKSKLVQEWLFDHGCEWLHDGKNAQTDFNDALLTNTDYYGTKEKCIMFSKSDSKTNAQEIVLEFETIVKSVQLPEVASKKTEAQLKLEELQKIIEDAQNKIDELKGEMK